MARFVGLDELFAGRHFDREIIVLCVRWYLRFKLSFRDLVEMMAERGLSLVHTTIMRWVHRYTPEFERRWKRFARPAGSSWRVDETYVKIRGKWVYLYRAVDRDGRTLDFRLSTRRDVGAAKAFFRKAIESQGSSPRTITLDGFKWFRTAAITIAGVELLRRIHKGQFDLRSLRLKDRTASAISKASLAA
jgi:transposase-like protein